MTLTKIMLASTLLMWASNPRVLASAYGVYGLYPVGSTRVLGMGGAFAGLSDDASAINFNPAGLAMTRFKYDLASGSNRIVNKELDIWGTGQKIGVPYNFNFYSAAFRSGSLAFGGGFSQPFQLDLNESTSSEDVLHIESYELFLAYKFSEHFSLGVTLHQERASMKYSNSWSSIDFETEQSKPYPTVGLTYRDSRRKGFGVVYSPERRYDLDESGNTQIGTTFIRDIVIPAKLTVGGFFKSHDKLIWVLDVDFVQPVTDAVFIYDVSSYSTHKIVEQQATIVHGGYELEIVNQRDLEFVWRGGGYTEPPRFAMNSSRFHFTMGVELRLGIVTMAASYDQSEGFNNMAQSISLNIDSI